MPLQSSGQAISFRAEVLEGDGSLCPPLIGNPSLRQLNATIYSNYFENGDGLLTAGMRERYPEEQQVTMFRLLLTDSGHYISTADDEGAAPLPRQDKIKKEVMWFNGQVLQAMERCPSPTVLLYQAGTAEGDRGEVEESREGRCLGNQPMKMILVRHHHNLCQSQIRAPASRRNSSRSPSSCGAADTLD